MKASLILLASTLIIMLAAISNQQPITGRAVSYDVQETVLFAENSGDEVAVTVIPGESGAANVLTLVQQGKAVRFSLPCQNRCTRPKKIMIPKQALQEQLEGGSQTIEILDYATMKNKRYALSV